MRPECLNTVGEMWFLAWEQRHSEGQGVTLRADVGEGPAGGRAHSTSLFSALDIWFQMDSPPLYRTSVIRPSSLLLSSLPILVQ